MALMADTPPPPRVLIVDVDAAIRDGLVDVFARAGFAASAAADLAAMASHLAAKRDDHIVLVL
jgi:DNA-binding response OmpR family regulator